MKYSRLSLFRSAPTLLCPVACMLRAFPLLPDGRYSIIIAIGSATPFDTISIFEGAMGGARNAVFSRP